MLTRAMLILTGALLLQANKPADPAAAFGLRESVEQISMSPDGTKLAYITPRDGQGSALYTVTLDGSEPKLVTVADGEPKSHSHFRRISERRLVCTIFAMVRADRRNLPVSRLVAVNADGSGFQLLSAGGDEDYAGLGGGAVIDWLPDEKERVLIHTYGVSRVDTTDAEFEEVISARRGAHEFITDGRGHVVIKGMQSVRGATEMVGDRRRYSYRLDESNDWKEFSTYNFVTGEGLDPIAVDGGYAWAFEKVDGRKALFRVSLDDSLRKELMFAHPLVDVDEVIRIGRRGRIVGAGFATEKRGAAYFDPELKALAAALSRALPGLPLIRFVDSSMDEGKLLLWAGSDTDPGRYYVYDKASRKLAEVLLSRPQLEDVVLASVKPVTYRAADGAMIPAYLTLPAGSSGKGLPAIVMPHGGPSARDEWGFDWMAQYFAARGFAVLQPNFRGSAGYGDEWFQENGFKAWRTAIGDINDGGRWLIAEGVADPSRLGIVGWSYGGYAALQAGVVDPGLFKAIVAIAPVTDLRVLKEESRGWTNFALQREFIGEGHHVAQGSPARNAAAFAAPVLIFHGERDRNVNPNQSKIMKEALVDAGKAVELIVFPKLDHYLEDSAARIEMLKKSDAFLRSSIGM